VKDGEGARELRELPEPLNDAPERMDREWGAAPFPEFPRLLSFLSLGPEVVDHSLSAVAGELVCSSVLVLLEADPEKEEVLALISLSFPCSSNLLKIRERALLYAASRSSIVILFLELPPVALLLPPWLPDSEGSKSERSASSPAIDPV
jgi:hypothetical protein